MDINKTNNNLNRRRAFRIYEQVDLFFHKLESADERQQSIDVSNISDHVSQSLAFTNSESEQSLPDSHSQENDSLDVNISSSGISFTCKEKLVAGDHLIIRLFLLSSMTVIMTCCKVVYIKPSNPFEKNHYPYQVGAQFVNLKPEDQALLHRHINKKKHLRLLVNGLLASFFITLFMMPDLAFELFLGLCSFMIDEVVEILNLSYEMFEFSLDHLIENIFHTDMKATQTIGFYTQIIVGLALSYPLIRLIYSTTKNVIFASRLFYGRKKSSFFYYWGEQTLLYKIGLISIGIMAITCYLLFFI